MAEAVTHIGRIGAGFPEPVVDSQKCFRALMNALAFPGRVQCVPTSPETPQGWSSALAAATLTLLDAETPVWLDETAATPDARSMIRFHAGAPIVDRPERASFCVLLDPATAPYDAFPIGLDQYPDRSATLLLQTDALTAGPTQILRGPGVDGVQSFEPKADLSTFWTAWRRNHALFPLGFDAFFFAGDEVAGLPRSVAAEEA